MSLLGRAARILVLVLLSVPVAAVALGGRAPTRAAADTGAWQWYKADSHVHSSGVSGDAAQDLGVMSQAAQTQGLNALFLTDHGAASNNPTGAAIANHILFEDAFTYWKTATYGSVSSKTFSLASTPVRTGSQSLHLAATSSGYGESITWQKRGPNLHSGDLILKFSVYPTRIDPGSGAYVSLAIGGDATLRDATGSGCDSTSGHGGPPNGYTTQAGVISPGKSDVLVWQLGNPRTASSNPDSRVITYPLSYTPNAWNDYTINVTQALNDIPAADRPDDYNAVGHLKMAAAANAGTADAYFDSFHLDASTPVSNANEFIHRNSIVHTYDTAGYKVFPGLEAGTNGHTSRFNYDITDPSQYTLYTQGYGSIPATQASGYPAQLDHPGFPGGVTVQAAIDNNAYGADLMEAVPRAADETMLTIWDAILKKGIPLVGTWSSDAHRTERFGQGTEIYAPSLDFDPLMRSLYEGRVYGANNDFPGRVIFNTDQSQAPYPARYPTYVSSAATSADVSLSVTDGLSGGAKIRWVKDGATLATDSTSSTSYQATKTVPLTTLPTYVRAEVRSSANVLLAMSEPIMFLGVGSLPADVSYHMTGVATPDGKKYAKTTVKGIASSAWSNATDTLSMTLSNPADSISDAVVSTGLRVPLAVTIDGTTVVPAPSLADEQAATDSSWFYDATTGTLSLRDVQQSGSSAVAIVFGAGGGADTQAPTTPTGLTATAQSSSRIDLSWSASSDDVGVTGYTIYRDGSEIATVDGSTTAFSDTGLAPSTIYSYTVDAVDAATNRSAQSSPASDTTVTPAGSTSTFNPQADAYVDSTSAQTQSTNYGLLTTLRADASPDTFSYLRFNVAGLSGSVSKATLRVYANSAHATGFDVFGVADNTWTETGLNYNNKPPLAALKTGSSGKLTAATYASVDVTSLITGNGTYSLAVRTPSSTALSVGSRESANKPQLEITTKGANNPPNAADGSVSATSGSAAAWTPSVSDPDGDTLSCSIVSQPAHGSASVAPDCSSGSYTSAANYTGADSFTYKATDPSNADSPPATVNATVAAGSASGTFDPVADAYVVGTSASSNFGTLSSLKVDASPDTLSYLRFNVTGLSGPATSATLKMYMTSSQATGFDVFGVSDNSWTETGLNYNNKPALAATKTGSSGPITAAKVNTYVSVDVTPLITGNGTYSLALTTPSTTALAMASRETANKPQLVVAAAAPDTQAPSTPTGLTATAASTSEIDLSWSASTDDVGVAGYTIYRDGNPLTTVGPTPSFQDTGLAPGTAHTYTVDAFDAATHHSGQSDPASATTGGTAGGPRTFDAVADAYVDSTSAQTQSTNYGLLPSLRADASPDTLSYLRFSVAGLSGPVSKATLRIYANSAHATGFDVFGVADNTWTETGLNYNNKPPLAALKTGSSGKLFAATYATVDVTPLITGNGTFNLALRTTSTTAMSLASREATNKPTLVVETLP